MSFLDISANAAASTALDDEPPVFRSIDVQASALTFDPLADDEPVYRSVMVDTGMAFGPTGAVVEPKMAPPAWGFPQADSQSKAAAKVPAFLVAAAPAAPALPGAPFPVEPEHFYSPLALGALVAAVEAALAAEGVVFAFKAAKVKFACAGGAAAGVDFVVRVFATAGRHLVEFQRRAGDAAAWRDVYGRVSARLQASADADACPQSPRRAAMGLPKRAFAPLALPAGGVSPAGAAALAAQATADVAPLLAAAEEQPAEMAGALAALAGADAAAAAKLAAAGAADALAGSLTGRGRRAARASAAAIASIARRAPLPRADRVRAALTAALATARDELARRQMAAALAEVPAMAVAPMQRAPQVLAM